MLVTIIINVIKVKNIIKDIFYVSKLTKIKKKKIRILFSAVVSNGISFADILIILSFSQILTDSIGVENIYLEAFLSRPYLVPIIVILRYFLNFISKYNLYSLTKDIERSLKTYLMEEVYKKGNYSIADATYYIETLSVHISYFFNAFSNIASSFIQILVFATYLSFDNSQVLLVLLASIMILYYPTKALLVKSRKVMDDSFRFAQYSVKDIQRIVENLYLVKILNTHLSEMKIYDKNLKSLFISEKKKFIISDINSSIPSAIAIFAFSMLLIIPSLTLFLSLEFIGITLRLVQTIGSINNSLSMLVGSHVHLEKLFLVEDNNIINSNFRTEVDENSEFSIKVENLSFRYFNSDSDFFNKVNLTFQENKHYIVTGTNGSGKSTLLGLLAGALNPSSGTIVRKTNYIGYIGASPLILDDTLETNLTYGKNSEVTKEQLLDLLSEFKVFTKIDENILEMKISNKTLSSGQMQKISFIRAFAGGCKILFLDESTANLDAKTKLQISQILNSKDITIINSTHNPEDFDYNFHLTIKVDDKDKRIIKLYE